MLVLLVDDNPMILKVTSKLLESLGFTPISATNRNEVLQILEQKNIEISHAIVDLKMPGVNIEDLVKILLETYPKIKIILSSGYEYDFIGEKIKNIPHHNFLKKPYSIDELKFVINNY